MENEHITWGTISETARNLGAGEWAIRKWKERGAVPPKWQIAISEELGCAPSAVAPDAHGAKSEAVE